MNKTLKQLNSTGALERINAIISCVEKNQNDEEIIKKLKNLCKDDEKIRGMRVGDFAIAVLDKIGAQKYLGKDKFIKHLIKADLR